MIAKHIKFSYDGEKAYQACLWLLRHHGGRLNKMKLLKLVFFADREHIFKYGRPICGGEYFAMKYGPVNSQVLDDINEGHQFSVSGNDVVEIGNSNERYLSESDIEILKQIDDQYGAYDEFRLSGITHALQVYLKHEPAPNSRKQMPYEDFFLDAPDSAMLDIIREEQEAWADFE